MRQLQCNQTVNIDDFEKENDFYLFEHDDYDHPFLGKVSKMVSPNYQTIIFNIIGPSMVGFSLNVREMTTNDGKMWINDAISIIHHFTDLQEPITMDYVIEKFPEFFI